MWRIETATWGAFHLFPSLPGHLEHDVIAPYFTDEKSEAQ